jgi:anti-anti-sigma regulatory factor
VPGAGPLERLQLGDHVCAFVDGVDDGLDLTAQVVRAGLAAGDKVMVFTESLLPVAVFAGLESRGVAVGAARRSGQVAVLSAQEAYLRAGRFEPAGMLDALAEHLARASAEGYPGLRLVGDMAWALGGPPGAGRLAAYEAEVNGLYMDGRALGVCLYDRRAFDRDLLRRVACAHPATITGGDGAEWAPLVRLRRTTDPYGLRVSGEADLTTAQALAAALDAVLDQQPEPATPLHLDVEGLRFADAATAALLGRLAQRAPAGVHVVGCSRVVEKLLDHLGVNRLSKVRVTRGGQNRGTELTA